MRFVSILALLALVGCMVNPSSSDDGSGGASACDGKGSCDDCLTCAAQLACAQVISSCLNSSPCAGIDQCMYICDIDAACKQQCLINNPSGVAAYSAVESCLYCNQCPDDCSGHRDCS